MAPAHPHATGVAVYLALFSFFVDARIIFFLCGSLTSSDRQFSNWKWPNFSINKAGYTATPVACGWAGAIFEVTRAFGQEQ